MASFFLETCCVKQSIYRSKNNVAECILEKYGVSGVGTTPKKKRRACVHSKSSTVLMG